MELKDVSIYKEHNLYYMKLIYNYTDDKGNEHCRVFPKVCFPEPLSYITPMPEMGNDSPNISNSTLEEIDKFYCNKFWLPNGWSGIYPCIDLKTNHVTIKEGVVATPEGICNDALFVDWITKYATYDMTLEEIENELGYKVKIVSEKEKSTENKVKK